MDKPLLTLEEVWRISNDQSHALCLVMCDIFSAAIARTTRQSKEGTGVEGMCAMEWMRHYLRGEKLIWGQWETKEDIPLARQRQLENILDAIGILTEAFHGDKREIERVQELLSRYYSGGEDFDEEEMEREAERKKRRESKVGSKLV